MHTRIAGGCLYHASVALGKPINKRDCEKQSLCRLFAFTAVHKTNLLRFKFCFFVFSYRLQLRQKLSEQTKLLSILFRLFELRLHCC